MKNAYYHKSPPQNYLVEELLLGNILIYPYFIAYITNLIKIESFNFEIHQLIYRTILELSKNKNINPVALIYLLTSNKILKKIGGIKKIIHIIQQSQLFSSSKNRHHYIEKLVLIIHNNYIKRLLIQYGFNIIQLGYLNTLNTQQLHYKAIKYLNYISQDNTRENLDKFNELIGNFLSKTNYYTKSFNKYTKKIDYGFQELDLLLDGLSQGDLIIIAGRPSIGKTSFVINIAYHLINACHVGICIFSLEMSKLQILHKLIAIASKIPIQIIKSGKINNKQWNIIQTICTQLLISQFYINDQSNISIDYIKNTSILIKKEKKNIELIIIDYLQLVHLNNSKYETRTQELSYITRSLKILAKNLNLPIIVLSQLNRNIEKRINKKPLLSDLRESGCVSLKILIQINIFNSIHIKNIINTNQSISIHTFSGNFINTNKLINNYFPYRIITLSQYIFNIYDYLEITHTHKILTRNKWQRQNILLQNNYILKKTSYRQNIIIEHIKLKHIQFSHFADVYDIQMNEYTNFLCKHIIIHNSIEQDADIVMMLCKENNEKKQESNLTVLDIIIAKNRNGPIGSIKLIFHPNNTIFTSI